MSRILARILIGAALMPAPGLALAQASAPSPPPFPAMGGPLAADAAAPSFDLGPLGSKVTISGALSLLAYDQSNPIPPDEADRIDPSNVQLFINKASGTVQYFVQVGVYSLPALGTPYLPALSSQSALYGLVPQAFIKIAPDKTWSIEAGKLPTLVGAESTFTFQNMNIERGLLWNEEPAVSRGVQVNYAKGRLSASLSWNDGFYSDRFTWVSGSASLTLEPADTIQFIGAGDLARSRVSTLATPLFLNNESIFNLIFTHAKGPWTIEPYLQWSHVPAMAAPAAPSASTFGAALLVDYVFPSASKLKGFSLPVRLEWITTTGSAAAGAPNLLFGPGSQAFSFTITPTRQFGIAFVRAEFSLVEASRTLAGAAFGTNGDLRSQARGLAEFGFLF
ncbi:MAG: outer membrane beta-barrel protein [Caulobacteraceae bacterium]